ncbi:Uncharacterised protein [Segatella copri]|nr:Uncharacterised protein [Segatella copri]
MMLFAMLQDESYLLIEECFFVQCQILFEFWLIKQ